MRCVNIIEKLNELSPVSYAAEWDNVGLLVGNEEKEIKSVYIALDATDEVIDRAAECGADLLLTHHPMIFKAIKRVNETDITGRRIIRLIRGDICYYAMHTNFDVMGMADAAADEIALKDREVLEVTYKDEIGEEGFGRIGKLSHSMTLSECAEFVRESFHLSHVKVFGNPETVLKTAAILPGSGKSTIASALGKNADVLITGDIDHHEGIDAVAAGMAVIDAGHFGIEKIFVPYMRQYLERECRDLTIYEDHSPEPFLIF
ncbi:Nif3-like dinuclear metal center hexameric protein [bacterium C-53]|nr:Nif3-like dinuclear metal center hexameric protein [Lachnospiraceae bacterium]NBI04427.1 Nif3-like dinuclear metal center hexameric protein [Lachnospiraceae bacterium]RKJ08211.1 Nif3-like dinuclear metal center hexameric protein [bacterium C-53]